MLKMLVWAVLTVAAVPAAAQDLSIDGELTRADFETYQDVPVTVPAGVERVTVRLTYDKAEHTVVDLGLWDPARFRGWSGGSRDTITLAASDASPGYLPGPIPAGTWKVTLGVPNIRNGVRAHYRLEVFFDRARSGAAAHAASVVPISRGSAWYRGDLHMHDASSDGSCATRSRASRVPCPLFRTVAAAAATGLDFIAVTDHNTMAQFDGLRELQPWFDQLLLIPGTELTTFRGHANAFGAGRFIDFRLASRSGVRALQDDVAAAGALLSINHPSLPSGEACMGCGWTWSNVDWSRVTAVEAINGAMSSGPLAGVNFWYARLNEGHRLTGIAGSDNHDPDAPAGKSPIGRPTTVVHAESLETASILAGLKAGNVFIDVEGTRDRLLEVEGRDEGGSVAMGGVLPGRGDIVISAHIGGALGYTAGLVVDGITIPSDQIVPSADAVVTFRVPRTKVKRWLLVTVGNGHRPLLIGNPIYFLKS
jgi:hypothetical protein